MSSELTNMRLLNQIDGLLTRAVSNAQDMQQGKLKYYEDNHDDTFDIERIQAELIPTIDNYLKSLTSASHLDYAKLYALTDALYRSRRIEVARNFLILDFSMPGTAEQASFVYSPTPSVRSRKLMNPTRTVQPDNDENTIDARIKKSCAMRVCIRIDPNGVRGDVSLRVSALQPVLMHLKSLLPECQFDIGCFEPQKKHQMVILVVLQGSASGISMTLPVGFERWTQPKSLLFLRFLSPNEQTPPLESRVMAFSTGGYNAVNGNLVRARQIAERLAVDISNACGNALQTRLPEASDLSSILQEISNQSNTDSFQLSSGACFKKLNNFWECPELQLRYDDQELFDQRIGLVVGTDGKYKFHGACNPQHWKPDMHFAVCGSSLASAIIVPLRRYVLSEICNLATDPAASDLFIGFSGSFNKSFAGELKVETYTGAWVNVPLHTFLTDDTGTLYPVDDMDATFRLLEDALRQRGGRIYVAHQIDAQSQAWARQMGVNHTLGANVIEQAAARQIESHLKRLKQVADEVNSTFLADNLVDLKDFLANSSSQELTLDTTCLELMSDNTYRYKSQCDQNIVQWVLDPTSNMILQCSDQIYTMAKTHERFLQTGLEHLFQGELSKRIFDKMSKSISVVPYAPQDLALRLQALLREGKPELIDPVTSCIFVKEMNNAADVTYYCKDLELRLRTKSGNSADMPVEIEDIARNLFYRLADNTFNRNTYTWKAIPGKPHLYVLPFWCLQDYVFDTTSRLFVKTIKPVNWLQKVAEQICKVYNPLQTGNSIKDPISLITFTGQTRPACRAMAICNEVFQLSQLSRHTNTQLSEKEDLFDLPWELLNSAFAFFACGNQRSRPEYIQRLLVTTQTTFLKICNFLQAPTCVQNAIKSDHFLSQLIQVLQGGSIKLLFQAVITVLPAADQQIAELISIFAEWATSPQDQISQRLQTLQHDDVKEFVNVLNDALSPQPMQANLTASGAERLEPLLQAVRASTATITPPMTSIDILSCIKSQVHPDMQYVSDAGLPGLPGLPGLVFIPAENGSATKPRAAILMDSIAGIVYSMNSSMVVDKIYSVEEGASAACPFTKSKDYPGLLEEACTHSLYDPIIRKTVSVKNKMTLPVVSRQTPVRRELQTDHVVLTTELGPVFAKIGTQEFRLSPLQKQDNMDVTPVIQTIKPKLEAVVNLASDLIEARSPSYGKIFRAAAFMLKNENLSAIQALPGGKRGGANATEISHTMLATIQSAASSLGKSWPELPGIVLLILQILRHILQIWDMIRSEIKIPHDEGLRIPRLKLFDAAFYANLAAAAYLVPNLRRALLEKAGLQTSDEFNEIRTYLIRDEKNKLAVIVFRGTVPTDILDLQADVQLALNRQNQQKLYLEAQKFAQKVVSQLSGDWHIVTTGHSLGGNIAAAVSHFIQHSLQRQCDFVVFSPGSTFLPSLIDGPSIENDPRVMIAFVLKKDIIAKNTGSSIYLDRSVIVNIEEEVFNQLSFETKSVVLKVAQRIGESLLAHVMGNYLSRGALLGEALTQALATQNLT